MDSENDDAAWYQEQVLQQQWESVHMPKVGDMIQSKYLKKEDIPIPALVTISHIDKVDVSMANKPPEMKYIMSFHEYDKPLVLNVTKIMVCTEAFGSTEDTDLNDWIGRQIVIYADPNIMFGTERVGGIGLRASKAQPPQAQQAQVPQAPQAPQTQPPQTQPSLQDQRQAPPPPFDDDIPF